MKIINIENQEQLNNALKSNAKNYLLFYKSNSETSQCAYRSLEEVQDIENIQILAVDVSQVNNIHQKYNVTTAPTLLELDYDKVINNIKGCNPPDYYKNIFTGSVFVAKQQSDSKPQKRVIVYSTPSCPWCTKLKQYLRENQIVFTDIDVSKDTRAAEEMVRKSGQQGVPQADINGQIVVGFDKQKIDKLLEIKNN